MSCSPLVILISTCLLLAILSRILTLLSFVTVFIWLITEATCATNCSISLTDLLLTSNLECFALSGTMKLGLRDHDLTYTFREQKIAQPPPKPIEYWSMKGFKRDCYLADLSKIPSVSAYIYDDTDDIFEHWHHLFITVMSTCHSKRSTLEAISCPGLLSRSPLQFPGIISFSRKLREINLLITGNNLRSRETLLPP